MRATWFRWPLPIGMAAICSAICATLAPTPAAAYEMRAGLYGHHVIGARGEPDGVDISAEFLFDSPDLLSWTFAPRPRIGGTLNKSGGTSLAYLDLGWTVDVGASFFLDLSVGGAVHDGSLDDADGDENAYGCRLNFHETVSLGYHVTPDVSVMLSGEHMSNAGLCDENDGLTNVGVRVGYSF